MTNNSMYIYNNFHYGDNIFNLQFFNHIASYLRNNNISIIYYLNPGYILPLQNYTEGISDIVTLKSYSERNVKEHTFQLWIGQPGLKPCSFEIFDDFMIQFYNEAMKQLNIPLIITDYYFEDTSLIEMYNKLPSEFQDLDILIINAEPRSGQYHAYNNDKWGDQTFKGNSDWNNVILQLSESPKKYKIATTSPTTMEYIPCTMEHKLSLKHIGAISTHAKYIIAIHSGPIAPCYNSYAKEYVKKWFVFTNNGYIKHKYIDNISSDNIYSVLEYL